MYHNDKIESLYNLVTGDEDARVCKDIPDKACNDQPHNFFAYLSANLLGKVADEIASAKLILPWLFGVLGVPAAFVGFLVPIRESGVLLPQLAVAAWIRRMAIRKWVWVLGAGLSAASLLAMGLTGVSLTGVAAGWAMLIALLVFSLSRGLCSVSAKDVLGKTVSKSRRGRLMGLSAGIAGAFTLFIGLGIETLGRDAGAALLSGLLLLSAALWLPAMFSFATLREQPGATEGGGNAFSAALENLALLKTDPDFRRFVVTRILLLGVALTPPFYVLLIQQYSAGLAGLGLLIIAVGLADSISAPIWGHMADRSSRRVMALASTLAGLLGLVVALLALSESALLGNPWVMALTYLTLIIAHSGVRLGRKVYLVDMASEQSRAAMVAVSNTVVGLVMLGAGIVGVAAIWIGTAGVIGLLALVSLIAALYAVRLPEVSQ
ncbi:MAG: MFS transporter [Pseudomonadota bacterium]